MGKLLLLRQLDKGCISEAMSLLPAKMDSLKARAQLLKTTLQEANGTERDQDDPGKMLGPALGLWQFEKGGVYGVLRHASTADHAIRVCKRFGVPATTESVWRALKTNDVLAAAMARLNYYWSPNPLPEIKDEQGSWDEYIFCWRPSKPHRDRWHNNHHDVLEYLSQ